MRTLRVGQGLPNMFCLVAMSLGHLHSQCSIVCGSSLQRDTGSLWLLVAMQSAVHEFAGGGSISVLRLYGVTTAAFPWRPRQPSSRGNKCNRSGTHPTGPACRNGKERRTSIAVFSLRGTPFRRWSPSSFVPLLEEDAEKYRHLILLRMGFCRQVTP